MKRTLKGLISPALAWILPLLISALGYPASKAPEADHAIFYQQVDLSFASPASMTVAISYAPTLGFFKRRFNVGIGPRFSSLFGENGKVFRNVNAGRTSGGPSGTLTVDEARNFALNLMFAVSARLFAGLEVGMNIDLVGVGFGLGVTGEYAGLDPATAGAHNASPSHLDLFLFGNRDYGQLDSEFFVAYWFNPLGVRVGVSHMSVEYTTDRPLDGNNDRFRLNLTRAFIAFGLRF